MGWMHGGGGVGRYEHVWEETASPSNVLAVGVAKSDKCVK